MNAGIRVTCILILVGLWLILGASCSDDSPGSGSDGDSDSDMDGDTDSDSDGDSDTDSDNGGLNQFGLLGDTFRYGINGGHRNTGWGDDVQAALEARSGCNSQRISLPERHLVTWGYEIEVNDMNAYAALGMTAQVAFLTSPVREHSTAPSDAEDWELADYIPSNLYEPVTLSNGEINPDNYWAKYVFDTVSVYRDWIRVWEIWNEPDYTGNWADTLTWTQQPPTAAQLPRFNGSIYEYVRMLRVSREAAKLADPNALIATGGIGYASFLNAILRYTDNPADGSVTVEYPNTGGTYFDVLSFHHYPIYTTGDSNDGVDGYLQHLAELKAELTAAGKSVAGIETTESGAPRVAVGDYPGGEAYAHNYIMKLMTKAHAAGVHGIDWFTLSDGAALGASTDPYAYMGLFEDTVNLTSIDEAVITPTGIAYATCKELLGGALYDADGTRSLELPTNVDAEAFVTREGTTAMVMWARVSDDAMAVTVDASFVPMGQYYVYDFDFSVTANRREFNPSTAQTIELSGTPVVLIAH